MGKNSKEQLNKPFNAEQDIQEKRDEVQKLQNELGRVEIKGEEVDSLTLRLQQLLDVDINHDRGELQRFKKDQTRFNKKLSSVSREIGKIRRAIEELKNNAPQESVVKEIEEQKQEDIKELENIAAKEDFEFKDYENHYTDATGKLEEFIETVDGLDLEKDRASDIKDFQDLLKELKALLKEKNYTRFAEVRSVFNDELRKISAQVAAEKGFKKIEDEEYVNINPDKGPEHTIITVKKTKSSIKPIAKSEEKLTPPSLEQQDVERADRIKLHGSLHDDLMLLGEVIRQANIKDSSRKLFEKYDSDMAEMKEFLDKAYKTKDIKVFDSNINNFNRKISSLVGKLEPDLKYAYENNGVFPKEKLEPKKEIPTVVENPTEIKNVISEVKKEPKTKKVKAKKEKASPVVEKQAVEEKKEEKLTLDLEPEKPEEEVVLLEKKKMTNEAKTSEKGPTASGEIPDKGASEEKIIKTENKIEVSPDLPTEPENQDVEIDVSDLQGSAPTPEPKKKGLWARFAEGSRKLKDAIFNRETGKVAAKVGYDTVTSVLGIKIITDAVRWVKSGEGDLAQWWKGRKEAKETKESIATAYESITRLFEQTKNSKTLEESEKIAEHLADLKAKIEATDIPEDAKQTLRKRLGTITERNDNDLAEAKKERDYEMRNLMDNYIQNKVSGIKIARDAMNFALTATGLAALRGAMYAFASGLERASKARQKFAKETDGKEKSEIKYVAKDVFVNSAIETARALTGRGDKAGASRKTKVIDFIKAFGTVARGFGIYGLAVSGTTVHEQAVDKLISGLKENGVASTVSHNFIEHTKHVWDTYSNPTQIFKGQKESESSAVPSTPEHPPVVEHQEVPVPAEEIPKGIPIEKIIADNKLSAEFSHSLQNLIKDHPELNNEESVQNILNSTKIGPDTHSHHDTILKGTIDTLDESGGERRQVIFEEILKHGGAQSAADYLQSQHFSSQHLSHLSGYIRKGTPDEFLKFAEKYNPKDARMVSGLFQAMQGRESTDLANARLEVDATGSSAAIDNHVRGKVSYFGLEGGKPVLSGTGTVTVDQMGVVGVSAAKGAIPEKGLDLGKITSVKESMHEDWQNMGRKLAPQWEGNVANQGAEIPATNPQTEVPHTEVTPVVTRIEKTINTYKASEQTPVVEPKSNTAPVEKSIPVKSGLGAKEILETNAPKSEVVKPEKSTVLPESRAEVLLDKFLVEHGSNQKEFLATYEKMVDATAVSFVGMEDTLYPKEGANEFFQAKTNYLDSLQAKYKDALEHGTKLSAADLQKVDKLLKAEELFKKNNDRWGEMLNAALFSKEDAKVIELAFLPHQNPNTSPILANGSHAVRIYNPDLKKDAFWYEEAATFSVNKNGDLVISETGKGERIVPQKDVLNLVK
jgi:hypothetical protein